ncbi:MAG TPA: hypothetical protein VH107_20350 [Lacipirellulaceae bacterium]|jgi:hypothetical protein|nr:hypothetical protein [Lacipirellulaceae bacterium]
MTEHPNGKASAGMPDEAAIARLALQQTDARYFEDLASFGWTSIGRRIILAGALFPLIFVLFLNSISFVEGVLNGRLWITAAPPTIFGLLVALAAVGVIGGLIGFVWTCLTTIITLPVVHLAIWSLNIRTDWLKLAAFAGGLVAFIATLPCSTALPAIVTVGAPPGAFRLMLLIPAIATIVGQYGALSGGRRAVHMREAKIASRRALIAIGSSRFNFNEVSTANEKEPLRFQFRISHLLWLGLWMSLLFTAIRLSRMRFGVFFSVLLAWLLYQWVTLFLGTMIGRHVLPRWRDWRQTRST